MVMAGGTLKLLDGFNLEAMVGPSLVKSDPLRRCPCHDVALLRYPELDQYYLSSLES